MIPLISNQAAGAIVLAWRSALPADQQAGEARWFARSAVKSWIYFAINEDSIKVGWSHNPLQRIGRLGHDLRCPEFSPRLLIRDCYFCDEQRLLSFLRPFSVYGREVFDLGSPVFGLMRTMQLSADACFFDNPKAPYAKRLRRCRFCSGKDHTGQHCLVKTEAA